MIVDEEMILECIPELDEDKLIELIEVLGKSDEWHFCPNCSDICTIEGVYVPGKTYGPPESCYPDEHYIVCSECKKEI